MKDWQSNKKAHDKYWGSLYEFISKGIDNSNFEKSWTSLNRFELGSDVRTYGISDKFKTEPMSVFLSEKSEYLISALNPYITSNTDCIIELGSGWGRNILDLSTNKDFKNIDFIAGELSTSGQKVTKLFTNIFNLNVKSVDFNWHDVDSIYALLKSTSYTSVVIYSYYSIEQIPHLNCDVFKNVLNLNIDVKFVHIEPVGFQYNSKACPWTGAGDLHYNRNLKNCLDELQKDNLIELDNVDIGYFQSHTTEAGKNATLIQWRKKHLP